VANIRVPSKEERKTGWQTSEFRVKKKERKKERKRVANIRVRGWQTSESEGGKHPSQRVANIRVPSKEERKKERKTDQSWQASIHSKSVLSVKIYLFKSTLRIKIGCTV
jgi:hypothetical protein